MDSKSAEREAKYLTTAVRKALSELPHLYRNVQVKILFTDEDDQHLAVRIEGTPPFVNTDVVCNGEYIGRYNGWADALTIDEPDT